MNDNHPIDMVAGLGRDIGEYIKQQRSNAQISLRQLAKLAGVSNPYLSQIERGLRKPSAEILQQIARALRISAETLYVRAGILEDHGGEHDLAGEMLRDPYLTEEQKQTMLRIYLSFRRENGDKPVSPPVAGAEDGGETADAPHEERPDAG